MINKETLEAARNVAFRYLGYAARSRAEIERRLLKDDFPPEVIAAVVEEFTADGWLDDAQFAQDWIADRADRKLYGRERLRAELKQRGVDKELVQAALDTGDDEAEKARARAALGRRWRPELLAQADPEQRAAEKRKLSGFLQRRGFTWNIIRQVMSETMSNTE